MNTSKKLVVLLVALTFLVVGLPVAQAQDGTPAVDSRGKGTGLTKQTVTIAISPSEQKAALDSLTREAAAAAKPMELPSDSGPAMVDTAAKAEAEVAGAYGFVAPGQAAPDADAVLKAAYAADWAAVGPNAPLEAEAAALGPDGTSQVYTSYMVNGLSALQHLYPHKWVGRLSFSTPSGTSYCSATANNNNTIVTAAHCVYDTTNNRWYSSWVFQPAYRAGNVPYGSFAARSCTILNAWINLSGGYSINGWAKYDVAVCKMGNNSLGQTLNTAVGWAGREWNYGYERHVHDLGYPFKDYNNVYLSSAGLYLRTCVAETFYQTTDTRGMGCNYGGGISGGPWLRGYAIGGTSGWVTGVNSGLYVGTQNLYGARFTSSNIVPLCSAVANSC